jgi:hypothetical protein
MSKFLLNLLLQISKALVKSKIQFLIQKFLFPYFRPGRPYGPRGLWPSQPTGLAAPAGRNRPGQPTQPARRSRLHGKYIFSFGSRLPSWLPLPRLSINRAPAVSSIPHLQSPELTRAAAAPRPLSATHLHASGATRPLPPRLHFPSLNSPLKPSPVFNGVKAINTKVKLIGHPSPALPRPPIKGEHPHRVSLHLSPLLFPSLDA